MAVKIFYRYKYAYRRMMLLILLAIPPIMANCQDSMIYFRTGYINAEAFLDSLRPRIKEGIHSFPSALRKPWNLYVDGPMSINATKRLMLQEMDITFSSGSDTYVVKGRKPARHPRTPAPDPSRIPTIQLTVLDQNGEPLPGATISSHSLEEMAQTDENGGAQIPSGSLPDSILCTYTGLEPQWIAPGKSSSITIRMQPKNPMTGYVVFGYGKTERRLNTGNNTQVDRSADIPGNILGRLEGRAPGLLITSTSGVFTSVDKALLRGQLSFLCSTDPYFVVDGVPLSCSNQSLSNIYTGSAAGSLSVMTFLSIEDIESISVLSDADATALYGSRGANGVVLITTRQARPGKFRIDISLLAGTSQVTRRPQMLNESQYLAMRNTAFRNDGTTPNPNNAPEMTLWDTIQSNDWGKWLIGGKGHYSSERISFTHSIGRLNHLFAAGYLVETSVFPTSPWHKLFTYTDNLNYAAKDSSLQVQLYTTGSRDQNQQFNTDPSSLQTLVPNAPLPWDAHGKPVFEPGGLKWGTGNPWAVLMNRGFAKSSNILSGANIRYKLRSWVTLIANGGGNIIKTAEYSQVPIAGQYPQAGATGTSYRAYTGFQSWIGEPQIELTGQRGGWRSTLLAGYTWQGIRNTVTTMADSGFTSDQWLQQPDKAATQSQQTLSMDYLYKGAFARINLSLDDKYILNLTGRRDGSSRFNDGKDHGLFGAAGMAWLFGDEPWFRKNIPFFSLAKLRGSYGVTGNDGIGGGSQYAASAGSSAQNIFQNHPGPVPASRLDAKVAWEYIRKMEISLDLGIWQNRTLLTVTWYRHRTQNQLLPDSFPSIPSNAKLKDLPVKLQNSGFELTLMSTNIRGADFSWTTSLTVSLPVNRLISKKGLDDDKSKDLVVGQSPNALRGYHYLGVNKDSGYYMFEDRNKDGLLNDQDKIVVGNTDPTCFGGITNDFQLGPVKLSATLTWRFVKAINYLATLFTVNPPGSIAKAMTYSNYPVEALGDWSKKGDNATWRELSAKPSLAAKRNIADWYSSDGSLTNASFARLKSLCIAWPLPVQWVKQMHIRACQLSIEAENLLTLTAFKGPDPEIPEINNLPPLKKLQMRLSVGL